MSSCSVSFPELTRGSSAGKLKVDAPRMRGLCRCEARLLSHGMGQVGEMAGLAIDRDGLGTAVLCFSP